MVSEKELQAKVKKILLNEDLSQDDRYLDA